MIRCTRNQLLILVAAFTLTGCMSLAPRMAGSQFTGENTSSAAIAGNAPATEVMITPTRVASATSTLTASPTYTMSSTASIQPTATPSATASGSPTPPAPTSTRTPTLTSTPAATVTPESPAAPSPQPVAQADLVVLGPETQYPVRARVVRGWDYELVDASTNYDFVVHRDVFGMLAHQLDAERVTRYHRPSFFSFTPDGVFRIYLVDWAPHPNAQCAARGYGTTALVDFGGDPLGLNTNICIHNHSLYPLGDGEGAAIGYRCNGQCALAVAAPGTNLPSLILTAFAEALPRPATLGPAGRAGFGGEVYRPLGQGRWDAMLWRWADPFLEVVPAGRRSLHSKREPLCRAVLT